MVTEDIHFLKGLRLTQICFGLYQIQLYFSFPELSEETNCNISFGNSAQLLDLSSNEVEVWTYQDGKSPFNLNKLLNEVIEQISINLDQCIELTFSNQLKLSIFADPSSGESYSIGYKHNLFVV